MSQTEQKALKTEYGLFLSFYLDYLGNDFYTQGLSILSIIDIIGDFSN